MTSRAVAPAAFRLIRTLLLPPAVAGYVLFVARMIVHSRRAGTSATPLASCGLAMEDLRTVGFETDRAGAPAGFTTAVVPGPTSPSDRLGATA